MADGKKEPAHIINPLAEICGTCRATDITGWFRGRDGNMLPELWCRWKKKVVETIDRCHWWRRRKEEDLI